MTRALQPRKPGQGHTQSARVSQFDLHARAGKADALRLRAQTELRRRRLLGLARAHYRAGWPANSRRIPRVLLDPPEIDVVKPLDLLWPPVLVRVARQFPDMLCQVDGTRRGHPAEEVGCKAFAFGAHAHPIAPR